MRSLALGFLSGVVLCQQLTQLPDPQWIWLIPLFVFLVWRFRHPVLHFLNSAVLGFLWALLWASYVLQQGLPEELEGKDVLVTGVIQSVPESRGKGERFLFDIVSSGDVELNLKRVRLSWYGVHPHLQAGESWQLMVRLKRPRGFMNPGGFDFEKWLFQNRIRATGYVRDSDDNQLLESASVFSLHNQRQKLRDRLTEVMKDKPNAGLITALVMGDRADMSGQQWETLTVTGTNHLMAISGLHIGMVAGFAYMAVSWLWKRRESWLKRAPAKVVGLWAAMLAALIYAAIAGFSIPTQRALLMTITISLCLLSRYRLLPGQILGLALLLVLLLDPLAVMNAGFWLSYCAVAGILYVTVGRPGRQVVWRQWLVVQTILMFMLTPFLIILFQRFSLISPLANFIAVPWVSFLVVPLSLTGAVIINLFPDAATMLLLLAEKAMAALMWLLDYMANVPGAFMWHANSSPWLILPALVGVVWLFLPRGFPARWLGIIWILPLFLIHEPELEQGAFELTLLDVGQGLASMVRTKNHILVYDTGPKFNDDFDTGSAVVAPAIRHLGISRLDVLLVSHGDNDHIGGFESLMAELDVSRVITGVPHMMPDFAAEKCFAGQEWSWDGVQFQVLYPTADKVIQKGNNGSCVLRVSSEAGNALLSGDIESQAERILIESYTDLRTDVLVVPHHGSKTSSTEAFIESVKPQMALLPVGYRNRYRLPNKQVMGRYETAGVQLLSTVDSGAIRVGFHPHTPRTLNEYRRHSRKYWNSW